MLGTNICPPILGEHGTMSKMPTSSAADAVLDCSFSPVKDGAFMHRVALASAILLTTFIIVNCASNDAPSAPPPSDPDASAATIAPDPGPLLEHETGPGVVEAMPPLSVQADAWAKIEGHLYVRVPYPPELSGVILGPSNAARLIVDGAGYGLAVPAAQGRLPDRPWFYVRFAKNVDAGDGFSVQWHQPAQRREEPGQRQRIEVSGLRSGAKNERLGQHFAEAAGKWLGGRGNHGFGAFAATRLQAMVGTAGRDSRDGRGQRARRTSLLDTMALISGLTSVEEALQADRGLGLDGGLEPSRRTIPIEKVPGVTLTKHPWEAMITALAQKPKPQRPVVEPLADVVPAEMAYLVFSDVAAAGVAWRSLAPTFGPLLLQPGALGTRRTQARYEEQLMLRLDTLAAKLGPGIVSSVAMITSAPYLADGTDLSLIFHVGDGAALDAVLDTEQARVRGARPDAVQDTIELVGRRIQRTTSADGAVRQHRVRVGDYLVVSNSRGAVQRILATVDGTHPALGRSGEFRYFRALYPYTSKEAGFLFLGDAFVGATVGPRQKILQSRRMRARSALRAVGFAALLQGWLEGRPATSMATLMDAGLLRPQDLRHHDGRKIRWTLDGGARSAWGSAGWTTPHFDLEIERITEEEEGAYQRFVETYQSYWKGFIDPIGVQLRVSEQGVDLDARMMPLLRRSDYRDLMELVGDTRLSLGEMAQGLRFVFAVAENSDLRRSLDAMGRSLSGHRDVGLGWLGDWVMVGTSDRSGLWDAALSIGEVPSKKATHQTRRADLRKRVLNRLPIYVAAQVRNRLGLAATLAGLKAQLSQVGMDLVTWEPTTPYGDVSVVKIQETLSRKKVEEPLSLLYAVVDDVFLVSLDRPTLEAQIDAVRGGAVPKIAETRTAGPQAALAYRPARPDGYLNRTTLGMLEHAAFSRHFNAMTAYETLAVGLGETAVGQFVSEERALAYLGAVPSSPHGGRYSVGSDGLVGHTQYGAYSAPSVLEIPVEGSALTQAVQAVSALRMSAGFEGAGRDRALVTHLHWGR